jgi:hypothetical protein
MILSDAEAVALIEALAEGRSSRGYTQEDVDNLLGWASAVYLQASYLGNILAGRMVIRDVQTTDDGYIEVVARAKHGTARTRRTGGAHTVGGTGGG